MGNMNHAYWQIQPDGSNKMPAESTTLVKTIAMDDGTVTIHHWRAKLWPINYRKHGKQQQQQQELQCWALVNASLKPDRLVQPMQKSGIVSAQDMKLQQAKSLEMKPANPQQNTTSLNSAKTSTKATGIDTLNE